MTIDEATYLDWHELRQNLFIQIAANYRDIQDVERVTYYWYQFVGADFKVRYSKIGTYGESNSGNALRRCLGCHQRRGTRNKADSQNQIKTPPELASARFPKGFNHLLLQPDI